MRGDRAVFTIFSKPESDGLRQKISNDNALLKKEHPLIKSAVFTILHREDVWIQGGLDIGYIRKLLVWDTKDGTTPLILEENDFVDLYNNYLIPLYKYLCGNTGLFSRPISSDANDVVHSKEELVNMFWFLSRCFSLPDLNTGIRLRLDGESARRKKKA